MIRLLDPRWRAVLLRDQESVGYLNRLFRRGWYLMEINADGISHLLFQVPVEPLKFIEPTNEHQSITAYESEYFFVIVLRKGTVRDRQRAVLTQRDEKGYVDLGIGESEGISIQEGAWRSLMVIGLGPVGVVSILERTE